MSTSCATSKTRGFFFRLFSVLLPLIFLGLLEAGLRFAGWGGYPPFIRTVGKLDSGETVCIVEPAASKPYFFANPKRPGYADQSNFLMPKRDGTVRIFLFGESAAKGYPQPRNLSMAAFLQSMLSDSWPGRAVEVINLGTTAVSSFPIVYMVEDALQYQPDLFVFYVGNNEFFGSYGTESINTPRWLSRHVAKAVRSLGIVQAAAEWLYGEPPENKTLMEEMMGRAVVPADSPSRAEAALQLKANLKSMLAMANRAGVPSIVCTTASNESGLAPLGGGIAAKQAFAQAQGFSQQGDLPAARAAFLKARDLDTLPWRPTSGTEQSIRDAAAEEQVILCDIAELFRRSSTNGATGWDLMDDHVHLSRAGQAKVARAIVSAMQTLPAPINTEATALESLADDEAYAARLGTNRFDDYRVNHTLRVLFGVPFMRDSNPGAFERYDRDCRGAEKLMTPALLAEARRWQTMEPHAGGLRPLTGMAARALLAAGQIEEARVLYEIAQSQVPEYTSWYLEYIYFALACTEKLSGTLTDSDRAQALRAIGQGKFLLAHGESTTGLAERYTGRLHQLREEWDEAIPYLLAARKKLNAEDLVACDHALVISYSKTGRRKEAEGLINNGIANSGQFSGIYKQMLTLLK